MARGMDGLLIIDKSEGMTSLDVVREIKRRLRAKKAGHIGTLDPFATGVLPIAINEGTKLVPFIEEGPKEYEVTLQLGEETTTDDWTGKVVMKKPWEEVQPEKIEALLSSFLGKIQQTPPMFSAIKMQGKPLYRLARKGVEVERKQREVEIYKIQLKKIDLPFVHFQISCSKGTYIRSLGRDLGRKIGCGGHLRHLRRTRSGPFTLEQAIPWSTVKGFFRRYQFSPWLISLEEALPSLPELIGDEQLVRKVRFGKEMVVQDLPSQVLPPFDKGEWVKISSPMEGLVAILKSEIRGGEIPWADPETVAFRPIRIFQPHERFSMEGRLC
ncbi:MAG: tRNA pseudouridine(55) synthase TruB [Syntrophaceae bacterium]|nr:tRNA pseudouridine(55) synthase TruB [Syntrophaceae bacterium]